MRRRELEFLARPRCLLCGEALVTLLRVGRLLRLDVQVVDITTDPSLEDEFDLRIPVVRDENQNVLAEGDYTRWHLVRALLGARLRG